MYFHAYMCIKSCLEGCILSHNEERAIPPYNFKLIAVD
jgi:hypothetical protein